MQQARSPVEVLSKDDLVEWFMHPITKKVRYKIEQTLLQAKGNLGAGWTLNLTSVEETAMRTARDVGYIEGLEFIFNIEADE